MLSIFILQGQEYSYIPYVQVGNVWSYCTIDRSFEPPSKFYERYTMIEDTICLDSNCYNKVFYGCPSNQSYYGAFREQDKKVYFVANGSSTEKLVYDFSLNVGDIFVYSVDEYRTEQRTVLDIDTIEIGGTLRKRFDFGGGIDWDWGWIEGIGNTYNFIEPEAQIIEYVHRLNYKKENGELIVYHDSATWFRENDCGNVGTDNAVPYDGTNTLFQNTPNPFNQSTMIKYQLSHNATNAKICIYNLTGKQLQCYNLTATKGEGAIEVRASSLQSGMYLYSLIVDDKLISTKRMVLTE